MISFDCDQFWFILVSFTSRYLDYIVDDTMPTYPKSLTDQDMITFQRFGPFYLNRKREMEELSTLILSLMLFQFRSTATGAEDVVELAKSVG